MPLLNQRKQKRKYVARPGIEPRTSDLRVRCPTDCATRPGISERWLDDNRRVCAMESRVRLARKDFYLKRGSNPGPLDQ